MRIRFARETKRPYLGTCGGCQHALIEYAQAICHVPDADHEETNPKAKNLIISRLSCSLEGKSDQIFFIPPSRLFSIFAGQPATEPYQCNFGLNPEWKKKLEAAGIVFSGLDAAGEVRAFELPSHPFFIGTLFQPERSALINKEHPLIKAFVTAVSN